MSTAADPFLPSSGTSRQRSGFTLHVLTLGLFLVALASMVHNFAGVFAAILYAISIGEGRNGKIQTAGLAGAFWVIAMVAAIRLAMPASISLTPQIEEVLRFMSFALLAAALTRLTPRNLMVAIASILVFSALLYPVSKATGLFASADASGLLRFKAMMPHANHLGYIAAITIVTFIYMRLRGFCDGRLWWITIITASFLVLISRSSGSLFVTVLGLLVLPISLKPTLKRALLTLVIVLALVGLSSTATAQSALNKVFVVDFDTVVNRAYTLSFGNQGSSFAWRMSYWIALINSLIENGTYSIIFGEGGGAAAKDQAIFFFMEKDPHSDLVKSTIEYGFLGFTIIFVALLRAGWKVGAAFIGLVVLIGPMLTGNSLTSTSVIIPMLINLTMLQKYEKGLLDDT